jgi:AbrB family looped-hinge helix DNA binding protein
MTVRTTKITRKGQITIPIDFREKYNFKEGDTVLVEDRDGRLTIQHPDQAVDWTAGYVGQHAKHRRYYSPAELRELAEIAIAEQTMDGMEE